MTAGAFNDLWLFNITSGNWKWKGGALETNPPPKYPNQIGGVGWPGGSYLSAACNHLRTAFIFGGTSMDNAL